MISLSRVAAAVFILWIFLRTLSYGKWTWNRKNKLGGVMVMLIAFTVAILAIYEIFIKG